VNLGWPVLGSIAVHVAGVILASSVIALAPAAEAPPAVPIEVVRVDAPAPPLPPPPPPKPREKIVPPKLAVKPQEMEIPTTPLAPVPLQEELRPRRATLPSASESFARVPASALAAPGAPVLDALGTSSQALAGVRTRFGKGDVLLPVSGGSGGRGTGARDVAAIPQETTDGGGLTDFARPLGGYQTKPGYPESARRQGIEGVTTLRFQVLTSGHVGSVTVASSAGNAALDRAAMEAVRTWLFEPARRGKDVVAVWVTLPVRFHLQGD
jgi:protein TonB